MSESVQQRPNGFQFIFEVEPATRPDLTGVRHQIGVMSRAASAFLIPDNHIGRATVPPIAEGSVRVVHGGDSARPGCGDAFHSRRQTGQRLARTSC